tara:strand:+ start:12855 stop:13679 length:825 start_codon:yes stop_codon:yes gene_type:complete
MCNAQMLSQLGRYGDTEIAHVNPQEKQMLESMGGSGTTNPMTGLKEYHWYHRHNPIVIPTPKIDPPKIDPPKIEIPKPKILQDAQDFVDKNTDSLTDGSLEEGFKDMTDSMFTETPRRLLEGDITLQEALDMQYQGGDVDQTLEMGQYIWNEIDRLRKGETTQTEEGVNVSKDTVEDYLEVGPDMQDLITTLGDVGTEGFANLIGTWDKDRKSTSEGGITPVTRGGDELVEEDLATLQSDPKSHLRRKKRGKKQFRISAPGVNVGGGGSGLKIA